MEILCSRLWTKDMKSCENTAACFLRRKAKWVVSRQENLQKLYFSQQNDLQTFCLMTFCVMF